MFAHDDLCSEVDKVYLKHFGDEGKTSGNPQITLDDLDIVLLRNELYIKGTCNLQRFRNLLGDDLDPPHCFQIGSLGRQYHCRIP